MSDYLDPNNEELLKDFFSEADQQVEVLEQNILVLENDPGNHDAVDEIFRAAHTLKGAAATVQMTELSGFTHLVEDVLDEIRSKTVTVTEEVVDTLLESIDIIKAMLETRAEGSVYEKDISQNKNDLSALLPEHGKGAQKKPQAKPAPKQMAALESKPEPAEEEVPAAMTLSEYDLLELKEAAKSGETIYHVSVLFNEDNPMNSVGGIQVFAALKAVGSVLKTVPEFEKLYEDQFFPQVSYYLSSQADVDTIAKRLLIPEVVTIRR
jgi:two-component system chemotaxis sensor kinase CheA